jgi:hypothetical protein
MGLLSNLMSKIFSHGGVQLRVEQWQETSGCGLGRGDGAATGWRQNCITPVTRMTQLP